MCALSARATLSSIRTLIAASPLLLGFACGSPTPARQTPLPAVRAAPVAECTEPYECALRHRGCCPPCGIPALADVSAVPRTQLEAHADRECPEPTGCPACVAGTNPSLAAVCNEGQCDAVDLRVDSLSVCTADAECVVIRRDCCNCDPGHVAVRAGTEADYYRGICGAEPICSPCEPHDIPATLTGRCVEGHCAVVTIEPVATPPAEPPVCNERCRPVDHGRCQPDGEPCTCGFLHQPFAGCRPRPNRPCRSARAFTRSCDPRCCGG